MQGDDDQTATWAPLRTASRAYGVSKEALRRRVHRGDLPHRSDNRGRLLVPLPADTGRQGGALAAPLRRHQGGSEAPTVAALRERLAAREAELASVAAERDRLAELLREALRGRERRPWPGLKAWWRRLWEGEADG